MLWAHTCWHWNRDTAKAWLGRDPEHEWMLVEAERAAVGLRFWVVWISAVSGSSACTIVAGGLLLTQLGRARGCLRSSGDDVPSSNDAWKSRGESSLHLEPGIRSCSCCSSTEPLSYVVQQVRKRLSQLGLHSMTSLAPLAPSCMAVSLSCKC